MEFDRERDTFIGYCDGASINLKGGWAYALKTTDNDPIETSGAQSPASKNEMELTAFAKLLRAVPEDGVGVIRAASSFVVHGITNWSNRWVANGWRKADGSAVENKDLWTELLALKAGRPDVRFQWVEGGTDANSVRIGSLASSEALRAPPPPPPGVPVHLIETWASGVRYEGHTIPEGETPPRFIIYEGSLYELDAFAEHSATHPYIKRDAVILEQKLVRRDA